MKRVLSASILAASLASGAAFAQVGPYVGASVGQSNYSSDNCVGTCDKTDIGMKVFGGYMFTPYLGLEGAYGAYGEAKVNTNVVVNGATYNALGQIKASGLSGFMIAQYPIDNFRLFGKLGFMYTNSKVDLNVPPQATLPAGYGNSSTESSTQFAWGVGGTYMFNKQVGMRLEYESMKYQFLNQDNTLAFWSIGVQYHF